MVIHHADGMYYIHVTCINRLHSRLLNSSRAQTKCMTQPTALMYSSIVHEGVNPSPKPKLGTNVGVLLHIGHRLFLIEDDLIQMIRLYLVPEVMGWAPCMCCALCNNPWPTEC